MKLFYSGCFLFTLYMYVIFEGKNISFFNNNLQLEKRKERREVAQKALEKAEEAGKYYIRKRCLLY